MSYTSFKLSFQKSPIFFVGGIAQGLSGNTLPIISITQSYAYNGVQLQASPSLNLDDFLFDFFPLPGGRLAKFQYGRYPFANQTIAANAAITEPVNVSLLMHAYPRNDSAYVDKLQAFQNLQSVIQQHNQAGGTYTVATPAYLYTNLLLEDLHDVSVGDEKVPQSRWQWDFYQPLLTLQQAQAAPKLVDE